MKQFICEEISVVFNKDLFLEKNPPCPNEIVWRKEKIHVKNLLSSWTDFSQKREHTKNMQSGHSERTGINGSWGVGRRYFKIEDDDERIIIMYYDRAPKNSLDKKGIWVLLSINNV